MYPTVFQALIHSLLSILKIKMVSTKPEVKRPDRKKFLTKSFGSMKKKQALSDKATNDISSQPSHSGKLWRKIKPQIQYRAIWCALKVARAGHRLGM